MISDILRQLQSSSGKKCVPTNEQRCYSSCSRRHEISETTNAFVDSKKICYIDIDTDRHSQLISLRLILITIQFWKMKLGFATSTLILVLSFYSGNAFLPNAKTWKNHVKLSVASEIAPIDLSIVGTMSFRELQKHCTARNIDSTGTTATLRKRLRDLCANKEEECLVDPFTMDVFGSENVRSPCTFVVTFLMTAFIIQWNEPKPNLTKT